MVFDEEIEDVDNRWQSFNRLIGSDKLDHLLWRLEFQILQIALKGLRMIECMYANRTFAWFSLTRWTLALVRVRVRLATCAAILAW